MLTNEQQHRRDWQKGVWRRARKTRSCRHYFTKACVGNGEIRKGVLYFDTEELNGEAGGFATHQCCSDCALAPAEEAKRA